MTITLSWAGSHSPPSCPRKETFEQPSFPLHNRHSRAGGNPELGVPGCTTVILAQAGIQNWGFPAAQPSFSRRRESKDWGFPLHNRHSHAGGNPELGVPRCTTVIPAQAGIQNWRFPAAQPSFPRRRESRIGGSPLHSRHSRAGGNPELGVPGCTTVILAQAGIQNWGFPTAQPSFPRRRESRIGGSRLHSRHSRAGGNPELGVPRCTAVIPAQAGIQNWGFPAAQPSFPRRRESRIGSYAKVSESGYPGVLRGIRLVVP